MTAYKPCTIYYIPSASDGMVYSFVIWNRSCCSPFIWKERFFCSEIYYIEWA